MAVMVGGVAAPEELAACIAWLASDEASNVNGVILPSDGGWSAI
jgi:NAD(P)-dependent dehydrogenase (short-subunit alcohol dehydrogenase family)